MIQAETFEKVVRCCFDTAEDKTVRGKLSWTPFEAAKVELLEPLSEPINGKYQNIYGLTEDNQLFTLYYATLLSSTLNSTTYSGNALIIGAIAPSYHDLKAKTVCATFEDLDKIFNTKLNVSVFEGGRFTVSANPAEESLLIFRSPEFNIRMEFTHSYIPKGIGQAMLSKQIYFKFEFHEITSFETCSDKVKAFGSFMAFMCGEHLDCFGYQLTLSDEEESLIGLPPDSKAYQALQKHKKSEASLLLKCSPPIERNLISAHIESLLGAMTYDELGEYFSKFLRIYSSNRTALSFYFSALASSGSFHQQIFMELIHGLEGFDRGVNPDGDLYIDEATYKTEVYDFLLSKMPTSLPDPLKAALKKRLEFGNHVSLRKRIRRILDRHEYLAPFYGKSAQFANEVTEYRNDLAHPSPAKYIWGSNATRYLMLMFQIKLLFELEILSALGWPKEKIQSVLRRLKAYRVLLYNPKKADR